MKKTLKNKSDNCFLFYRNIFTFANNNIMIMFSYLNIKLISLLAKLYGIIYPPPAISASSCIKLFY